MTARILAILTLTSGPAAGQMSGVLQPRLVLEDGCTVTPPETDAGNIEVMCSPGGRAFRVTSEQMESDDKTPGSGDAVREITRVTVDW